MTHALQYDVLVIGSGAAGLTLALHLADHMRIGVISKGQLSEGSTFWAQGGVAAVLDDTDTVDAHVQDTLEAGGGLCHEDAVRQIVGTSREAIGWLIEQGVPFTRETREDGSESDDFHLTMEGGHSHRRIIHAADATGAAIFNTLLLKAQAHANIELLENRVAVDLITTDKLGLPGERCLGAYILNRSSGHVETCGLPVYKQPRRRLRRRHCHGLAGGLPGGQHGIQPVPPHLPLPPQGQKLSGNRGPAGRRCAAQTAQRPALYAAF